ncbi:periplasmic protein [Salinisphaera hydrothermalis C41B8]|uniref:Periplasmic protein n=2 Tax=Salinisphaera TaxID=180541 RepID=A0A084IJB2_SALHC|nr:periplasmic protein [Salinisphaera hydrothermalis C41B8]
MLATLIAAGCSESPQEKYNDATSNLNDAKKARKQAQEKVADAREKVQDAQKNLKQAQNKLQQARQKVISATQAVNQTVSDEVLFRTLQKKLLDNDEFSKSAISVGVNQRVVTLTGTVPDQDTRKKAVQAVRSQPGVESVNDQLQVSNGKNDASQSGGGDTGQHDNTGQSGAGNS